MGLSADGTHNAAAAPSGERHNMCNSFLLLTPYLWRWSCVEEQHSNVLSSLTGHQMRIPSQGDWQSGVKELMQGETQTSSSSQQQGRIPQLMHMYSSVWIHSHWSQCLMCNFPFYIKCIFLILSPLCCCEFLDNFSANPWILLDFQVMEATVAVCCVTAKVHSKFRKVKNHIILYQKWCTASHFTTAYYIYSNIWIGWRCIFGWKLLLRNSLWSPIPLS